MSLLDEYGFLGPAASQLFRHKKAENRPLFDAVVSLVTEAEGLRGEIRAKDGPQAFSLILFERVLSSSQAGAILALRGLESSAHGAMRSALEALMRLKILQKDPDFFEALSLESLKIRLSRAKMQSALSEWGSSRSERFLTCNVVRTKPECLHGAGYLSPLL